MPWDHIYALAVVDKSFNMLFNHANPLRTAGQARARGESHGVCGGRPGEASPAEVG